MNIKDIERLQSFVEVWELEQADRHILMYISKDDISTFKKVIDIYSMCKKPMSDEYNEGWDSGYKVGHKDGRLIYLDAIRGIESIKDTLDILSKEIEEIEQ